MKKFKLINKYGNRVILTNSACEKARLLKKGFYLVNSNKRKGVDTNAK